MLFAVHIAVLINSILNIIDDCIEGGIRTFYLIFIEILYSFLFFFMFNPIILFLFYRGIFEIMKDIWEFAKTNQNLVFTFIFSLW
jgi:hypothetical protein